MLNTDAGAKIDRRMTQIENDPPSTAVGPSKRVSRHLVPIVALGIVAIVGWTVLGDTLNFETLRDNRDWLLAYRDSHYLVMAAVFVAIYVAIVAFSLPGATVASMTGGFLFGLGMGTALNVLGATVGASILFWIVRWGFGEALTARIAQADGKIKTLQQGLRDNEWSVMFLLRLVPAVPFFVANLLPALVGVRFTTFVVATGLGIIPGALVFTWIGVGLGEVFDRGGEPDLSLLWEPYIIGPLLGLALLAALPMVIQAIKGRAKRT